MQEVMERPERRRREGRRSVRFAFGRRSSLFYVPVLFLYLCLLWVSVFFGFHVGPAKLQRGATPPSVMVLFIYLLVWMFRRAGHCWMILSKLVEINYHRCFSFSQENNCPFPRSFRCSQHRELWLMSPEPNLKCHHQNYTKGQAIAGQGLLL